MRALSKLLAIACVAACDPGVTPLCEMRHECYPSVTVDGCIDGLRLELGSATDRGCAPEYEALVACQLEMDYTCSDNFERASGIACDLETCELQTCRQLGGESWNARKGGPDNPCPSAELEVTGSWSLMLYPNQCHEVRPFYIEVRAAAGSFELSHESFSVTGTITTRKVSASMTGVAESKTSGPRYTFDLFVFGEDREVYGTGTVQVNDCGGTMIVGGRVSP